MQQRFGEKSILRSHYIGFFFLPSSTVQRTVGFAVNTKDMLITYLPVRSPQNVQHPLSRARVNPVSLDKSTGAVSTSAPLQSHLINKNRLWARPEVDKILKTLRRQYGRGPTDSCISELTFVWAKATYIKTPLILHKISRIVKRIWRRSKSIIVDGTT